LLNKHPKALIIIGGDFNASVDVPLPGEEQLIGPFGIHGATMEHAL